MNTDSELKEILRLGLNNVVSRMEILKEPADRRCIFNEYKEWLGENINDYVLVIPREALQNENE